MRTFVAAEGLGHVPRSPCYVATAETRALGEIPRLRIFGASFSCMCIGNLGEGIIVPFLEARPACARCVDRGHMTWRGDK
jgi:hypothetical protein